MIKVGPPAVLTGSPEKQERQGNLRTESKNMRTFFNKHWWQLPVVFTLSLLCLVSRLEAQRPPKEYDFPGGDAGREIIIAAEEEAFAERMQRKITLDVRDMAVIDVLKFLALKGDFNMVTKAGIQGRATFYLKSVIIKDALDIAALSNKLAYVIEKNIVFVMTEAEYEATYGKRFNDRNVIEIVRLNYAKPSYVLSTLDNIKSNMGRIIIDEDTGSVVLIDTPEAVEEMKGAIVRLEAPLEPATFTLMYAKADVVAEKLRARVEGNQVGSITVDERTNKIIVRALPERRDEVEKMIKALDAPTKEVLVEARVLQIVFKPQSDFGIDWNIAFRNSDSLALRRMSFANIFLDADNLTSSDSLHSNYFQYAVGNIDEHSFDATIRALKQVSDTRILSNPKILVTNNQEAKIHVGDTVPYIVSTTSGTGDNAITSEDVRFVDVGLILQVSPTINDDGFITMILKPEISTIVARIESQGGGIPQVSKTSVETTVMVKDGMTVILGGLRKDNKVQTTKGIPYLMDVPLLGKLFRVDSRSIESTEIVILITPHIITGDEGYDEYRGSVKPSFDFDAMKKSMTGSKPENEKKELKLKE